MKAPRAAEGKVTLECELSGLMLLLQLWGEIFAG
jgi:hypothetical protein